MLFVPDDYIVLDLETAHRDPDKPALPTSDKYGNADFADVFVIEYATLSVLNRYASGAYAAPVEMPDGLPVPEQALAFCGIPEAEYRMHAERRSFAIKHCCRQLEPVGAVVGQNVIAFDLELLRLEAEREGVRIVWPELIFDTKLIWQAWCHRMMRWAHEPLMHFYGRVQGGRRSGQSSLAFLCRTFGIRQPAAHRAEADARNTQLVFERMRQLGIVEHVLQIGGAA